MDALKGANLDFAVPVFGTLLADQVLSVASVDSHALGGDTAFVLVTGDLELFGHLFHAFGDVVDCYAGLDVGLLHHYRQVVGIGLHIFLRSLVLLTQFLPLSVLVAHAGDEEEADLADHLVSMVDYRVCLVQFDLFEEHVNFRAFILVSVVVLQAENRALLLDTALQFLHKCQE